MPFRLFPVAAVLVAGLASVASAQTVTIRGEIENAGPTFVMSCTPLTLVSGGVNLGALLSQEVVATGTLVAPNVFSVASASPVTDVLEVNNDASVGGTLELQVSGPPGRVEQIYYSLNNGFDTIHSMGWFLGATVPHLLVQGVIAADGQLEVDIALPNLPVLANLELFFQDVRLPAGGGFVLGNTDCVTIQP
jgi:hypothetical protein